MTLSLTRHDGLELSADPSRLDVDRICGWLASSYWACHRDRAAIERSIANSFAVGAYAAGHGQVALTRATTDWVSFAWIGDVVVDQAWRGRGIGSWLVGSVVEHLRGAGVGRIALVTRDAHGVYAKLGFTPLADTSMWMERR